MGFSADGDTPACRTAGKHAHIDDGQFLAQPHGPSGKVEFNELVDYLWERQASLDFASLEAISRSLAGLFWAKIEAPAPGIDSLRLPPPVARAWKESLQTQTRTTTDVAGEVVELASPRRNAKHELLRVWAFYLDIAQWAVEDPARWGPWVAPCPISDAEISRAKDRTHRKARMDQRSLMNQGFGAPQAAARDAARAETYQRLSYL